MSSVFIPADVLLSLLFFVTQALQPAFMIPRVEPSEVFTALLRFSIGLFILQINVESVFLKNCSFGFLTGSQNICLVPQWRLITGKITK